MVCERIAVTASGQVRFEDGLDMSFRSRLMTCFARTALDVSWIGTRFHLIDDRRRTFDRAWTARRPTTAREEFGTVEAPKYQMREVRMVDRSSFVAGILVGAVATMAPVGFVWLTQRPSIHAQVTENEPPKASAPYYSLPSVTMRCGDREIHSVTMTRRQQPSLIEIIPPSGCTIVSVRRP